MPEVAEGRKCERCNATTVPIAATVLKSAMGDGVSRVLMCQSCAGVTRATHGDRFTVEGPYKLPAGARPTPEPEGQTETPEADGGAGDRVRDADGDTPVAKPVTKPVTTADGADTPTDEDGGNGNPS